MCLQIVIEVAVAVVLVLFGAFKLLDNFKPIHSAGSAPSKYVEMAVQSPNRVANTLSPVPLPTPQHTTRDVRKQK